MAARKRKITLTDNWKEKIQIGNIIHRLVSHVNGDCEMSPTQINAAKILLGKVAPDLTAQKAEVELSGEVRIEEIRRTIVK